MPKRKNYSRDYATLGPYCIAAGITPRLCESGGPFPTLQQPLSNGLVLELTSFALWKQFDQPHRKVATRLIFLGIQSSEDIIVASIDPIWSLRNQYRRTKNKNGICVLEHSAFQIVASPTLPQPTTDHASSTVPIPTNGPNPTINPGLSTVPTSSPTTDPASSTVPRPATDPCVSSVSHPVIDLTKSTADLTSTMQGQWVDEAVLT